MIQVRSYPQNWNRRVKRCGKRRFQDWAAKNVGESGHIAFHGPTWAGVNQTNTEKGPRLTI